MNSISNTTTCNCSPVAGAYALSETRRGAIEVKPSGLDGIKSTGGDRAEFSTDAIRAVKEAEGSVRNDLVNSVRERIANGTYESDAKIALVADRLVRLFGRE